MKYKPVGNYMFKVNNRNSRKRCEIYSKLKVTSATNDNFSKCVI